MKAPIPSKKVVSGSDPDPAAIEAKVRARAYQLFEARGCKAGHELEDWLRAEEEINAKETHASAT